MSYREIINMLNNNGTLPIDEDGIFMGVKAEKEYKHTYCLSNPVTHSDTKFMVSGWTKKDVRDFVSHCSEKGLDISVYKTKKRDIRK